MVNIPHLGKFKYLMGSKSTKRKALKEPIFLWQDYFLEEYGVKARSVPRGKITPEEREVNYASVAVLASLTKDTVVTTAKVLFEELGRRCRETKGQATKVRVELPGVGRFCCDRGMVKFSFASEWGTTRPGTSQTCRSLASRSSLASRGSIMGGDERPIATASSMQSGMRSALSSSCSSRLSTPGTASSRPRRVQSAELLTIEEMRGEAGELPEGEADEEAGDANGDRRAAPLGSKPAGKLPNKDRWDAPIVHAPHAEEWRAGGKGQEELSAFVKAVLEDGELEDADIEQLLSRTGTPASGSSRPRSAGDADSSILPVYFEPAEGRGPSLRVQAHKARAVRSTKAAFQKHKKTQDKERERIYRENKSVEVAQRRAAVEQLKQRMERQKQLLEMKATHQAQIKEREEYFAADHEWVISGDVGLPATNRFTGEPSRDAHLHPHLDRHRERLSEQVRTSLEPTASSSAAPCRDD